MIATIDRSWQELTDEFYSKTFHMSYSGLNKLLFSPKLFYKHYILNNKEDKIDSYLVEGKIIHCLLLDKEMFNKYFVVSPSSLPGDKTRRIIDKVFSIWQKEVRMSTLEKPERCITGLLWDYGPDIIEELKRINLHQSLKTDDQRVNKIVTEETRSYWDFLKVKGNKDLISEETLAYCQEAVSVLISNNEICLLLGTFVNQLKNCEVYNEKPLMAETDKRFGLKGIIDNIKINYDEKIIYINDLKTTGKTICDFEETIQYYNYWIQAAIYYRLILANFSHIITKEWKIIFNFIVIDKYFQVYAFEVSRETMGKWQIALEEKLEEADWHYLSHDYTLPYKFAHKKIVL